MPFLSSTVVSFVETFVALVDSVIGKGQEMMFPAKEIPSHVVHAIQSSTNLRIKIITFLCCYFHLLYVRFKLIEC